MCHHLCAVLGWCLLCTQPSPITPSYTHTHTLLSTLSLAQIMHTFIHIPHSQPHSFKPGNMPWVSLSQTHLHTGPEDPPCTQPTSKSHLPKPSQPAIHPLATPQGFPTPATHRERHKTKHYQTIHTKAGTPFVLFTGVSPGA